MGILADFYVSSDADAARYDEGQNLPDSELAEYKNITPLEISMLWSILKGQEWDVDLFNELRCVLERDGGERLIHKLPGELVAMLAGLSDDALSQAAVKWSQTEELACDASDLEPVLQDLKRLSMHAQDTQRSVYLWNCV